MPDDVTPDERKIVAASEVDEAAVRRKAGGTSRAPYAIVRRRVPEGTIRHDDRIPRYWKNRQTGNTVEVRRYLYVANEMKKRIIFVDEMMPDREVTSDLETFKKDFEPVGNRSDKF